MKLSLQRSWPIVGILAITQILCWGALYYAFSSLAPSIAQTLGMRTELAYGAFSSSLLLAGLVAAPASTLFRCLDRARRCNGARLIDCFIWALFCRGVPRRRQ